MNPLSPRKFLGTWVLGFVSILIALAAFNIAVDPYVMFDTRLISGFNAQKTGVSRNELMAKAYDAPRRAPRTLVLGSSIVDFGLDSLDPSWPGRARPVYNLGFAGGGGSRVAYLHLQYILSEQDVDTIVLSADYQLFLTGEWWSKSILQNPVMEARLAVGDDGVRLRQRVLDTLQASISISATLESISTVAASMEREGANFIGGNTPVPSSIFPVPVSVTNLYIGAYYRQARLDPTQMLFMRAVLDLCRDRGVEVIILINPIHPEVLEVFDRLGLWESFEDWKRELVMIASEHASSRHKVHVWDFTSYDADTIGNVTREGIVETYGLWLDGVHYTKSLGNRILRRMFANEELDFGVRIDRGNVEAHIKEIREAKTRYREDHPADIQRVQETMEKARGFRWN